MTSAESNSTRSLALAGPAVRAHRNVRSPWSHDERVHRPIERPSARHRLAVVVLAAAALLSCGRETETAPVARRDVVRVFTNAHIGYAPLFLAKDEGDFEAAGIDVEFVSTGTQNAMILLTTGQIDVLATPVRAGLFNLMSKGVAVQIVAERGHVDPAGCQSEAFAAPPAAAERIAKNGFRGERFALIRGGNMEFQIDLLLRNHGLTLADVVLMPIQEGGDYLANQSQHVEAIRYMQEPTLSGGLEDGSLKIVARVEKTAQGHPIGVLAYGKRMLKDDPDLGRRFMRAYLRGIRRLGAGKTPRNVEILSRYTKLPAEIVRRSCWQAVAPDALLDPKALAPFLSWAKANGHLDADVPTSVWWNPTFATEASRDLERAPSPTR